MASNPDNPELNISAQEIDARRAHHLWERAVSLAERGERNAAALSCRQAIALAPDYAAPYSLLGSILQRNGDPHGAIGAYQKYLSLNPQAMAERQALDDLLQEYPEATAEAIPDLNAAKADGIADNSVPPPAPVAMPVAVPVAMPEGPSPGIQPSRDLDRRELGEIKPRVSGKVASLAAIALGSALLVGFVLKSLSGKPQVTSPAPIVVNAPAAVSAPTAEPTPDAPAAPAMPGQATVTAPRAAPPSRAVTAPRAAPPSRAVAAPAPASAPTAVVRREVVQPAPESAATAPPAGYPASRPSIPNTRIRERVETRRPAAAPPAQSGPFTPGGVRAPVTASEMRGPSSGGGGGTGAQINPPSRSAVEHPVSPPLSRP